MARKPAQHRRSGRSTQFGAPLGRTVKLITGITLLLLVTLIVVPQLALRSEPVPFWVRLLAPTVLVIIITATSLFRVRGYTIRGRELVVLRSLWETQISLHGLKAAHADRAAMKGSRKTMGNGGLLVFAGWFRSRKLGKYRALVTDQDRCVVLEFKDSKLVVSPDDPEGFVKALGFEPDNSQSQP